MERVQKALASQYPNIRTFFSSGSMVDAILNSGMPAPIDIQVSGRNLNQIYDTAEDLATRVRQLPGVSRSLYPAGSELSRIAAEHRPRSNT